MDPEIELTQLTAEVFRSKTMEYINCGFTIHKIVVTYCNELVDRVDSEKGVYGKFNISYTTDRNEKMISQIDSIGTYNEEQI